MTNGTLLLRQPGVVAEGAESVAPTPPEPLLKSLGVVPVPGGPFKSDQMFWEKVGKDLQVDLSPRFIEHFTSSEEVHFAPHQLEVFTLTRSGPNLSIEVEDYLRSRTDLEFETDPFDIGYLLAVRKGSHEPTLIEDNVGSLFYLKSSRSEETFEVCVKFPSWSRVITISAAPIARPASLFSKMKRIESSHIDGRRFIVRNK